MKQHISSSIQHHAEIDCAQLNGIEMTILYKPENSSLTTYEAKLCLS
ncbi:hypothetical protein [Bartonella jaculi]